MKKILITGGHLSPALSVIPKLKESGFQIFFVGRKYAMEEDINTSEEFNEIKKINVPFYEITTGRIQRRVSSQSIKSLAKIPVGLIKAFQIIVSLKPDCILSFGGYVAVPVVVAGKLLGVPIVTHEQTVAPGLANRFIGRIANLVLISHEESSKFFPPTKTKLTGNPLRQEVFQSDLNKLPTSFTKQAKDKPMLYITGGNQGAHAINMVVLQILAILLEEFVVIHQTGSGKNITDYKRLLKAKESLPPVLNDSYLLFPYINSDLIGTMFKNASLIISRSGANTVSEIIALNKKAILIPLPHSAYSEQLKNAQKAESLGLASIIQEQNLTGDVLLQKIRSHLRENPKEKKTSTNQSLSYLGAGNKIVENIKELLKYEDSYS